MVISLLMWVQ